MDFESIRSIVVVGSSGAGKSTLVDSLRVPEFEPHIVIPKRFVTRAPRAGDNEVENLYVSQAQFAGLVAARNINPYWSRQPESAEGYGFWTTEYDTRLRVFSANNAFLRDPNETVREVLASSLVVVAMASERVRRERLERRSPELSEIERELRLRDSGDDILEMGLSPRVIYTDRMTPDEARADIRDVVRTVLALEVQTA